MSAFNKELEAYLKTPIRKRTKEQRIDAYVSFYDQLIDWWEAFEKRNPDTPIMRSEFIEINVPNVIAAMRKTRNEFLLGYGWDVLEM